MADELVCDQCGSADLWACVQHGSYVLACPTCRIDLVAISFISVAKGLEGSYRATIIDDDFKRTAVIAEGDSAIITALVREVAASGKRILLEPLE